MSLLILLATPGYYKNNEKAPKNSSVFAMGTLYYTTTMTLAATASYYNRTEWHMILQNCFGEMAPRPFPSYIHIYYILYMYP